MSTPADASSWPQEETWGGRTQDVEFSEWEPGQFPFTLHKCPVCFALVTWDDVRGHQTWHEETDKEGLLV